MTMRELFTIQLPPDGLNLDRAVELFGALARIWPTAEVENVDGGYLITEEVPDET